VVAADETPVADETTVSALDRAVPAAPAAEETADPDEGSAQRPGRRM
jgi:hypothetical protein